MTLVALLLAGLSLHPPWLQLRLHARRSQTVAKTKGFASKHNIGPRGTALEHEALIDAPVRSANAVNPGVFDAACDPVGHVECPVVATGLGAFVVSARVLLGLRLYARRVDPFRSPGKGGCCRRESARSDPGQFLAAPVAGR